MKLSRISLSSRSLASFFAVATLMHPIFRSPKVLSEPHEPPYLPPVMTAGVSLGQAENSLPPGVPRPDINVQPDVPQTEREVAQDANGITSF